ncbi:hypothetical protein MBLNU230_g8059t1 [Neophaeotheca triangularis]
MESTYRPQSPDLSGYAPQSPDLSGYRPQSPDLSAPLASPQYGGFNPYQQQQQQQQQQQRQYYQSGYGNVYGSNSLNYTPTSIPQEPSYAQHFTQQFAPQQYNMPVTTRRMNIKREDNGVDQHIPETVTVQQEQQTPFPPQQYPQPSLPQPMPLQSANGHPQTQAQFQHHYQPQLQQQPLPPPPAELHTELSAPLQKMKTENFKSHIKTEGGGPSDATLGVDLKTSFPVARIKRIMQADEDIGKVAQVTPHVVSRALELFMIKLVSGAAAQARGPAAQGGGGGQKGGKRILCQHMKKAVNADPTFDFLAEIVGKVPDAPASKAKKEVGSDSEEGPKPKKRSRKRKDSEDEA